MAEVNAQVVGLRFEGRPPHLAEEVAVGEELAGISDKYLDKRPLSQCETGVISLPGHGAL